MDLIHKFQPFPNHPDQCVYDIGGMNCGRPKDDPHHEGYVSGVMYQREADNLQLRCYSAAALSGLIAEGTFSNEQCVLVAWKIADLMLAEQKRRESAESAS